MFTHIIRYSEQENVGHSQDCAVETANDATAEQSRDDGEHLLHGGLPPPLCYRFRPLLAPFAGSSLRLARRKEPLKEPDSKEDGPERAEGRTFRCLLAEHYVLSPRLT